MFNRLFTAKFLVITSFGAVQNFYLDSRAGVHVGNDVSKWFPVNVGLRLGCVRSPWLFNVYMDGVVQEVNLGGAWETG